MQGMSRLWADANVILRFLTKDPLDLAERSARLMARAAKGEFSLYISALVLAEILWVLKSFYQYSLTDIARAIVPLVSAPGIGADDRELIIRAFGLSRDWNVDFVDSYLALQAAKRGEKACAWNG